MSNTNILYGRKAEFLTLGCKLNFAETATLSDRLAERGVTIAEKGEHADFCVVNTCSVTDVADQKCRQAIHRLARRHPDAPIVVMGCYAQLQPEMLSNIPGVRLVVGIKEKAHILELIEALFTQEAADIPVTADDEKTFVPSCSRGERTRYFLKVQDGCNYFCTYCTIPFARGRSRNGSIESLVAQAREVAQAGGREIVLTGVNIGDFGRTTGESFLDLIRSLDGIEGIERYRISSIEPNLLTDEVIDFCAGSRAFMPHFHIPLQCGSDEVLRLMRRRYDTSLFREKVERVHARMSDAFIGVDVIVGMRGETDELFEQSYEFLQSLDVSQLHVFSYSERPGTKALEIPHAVSPQVRHERSQRLIALSEEKRKAFYEKHIGTTRPVLWEHARAEHPLQGFTDNYIRVELSPSTPAACLSMKEGCTEMATLQKFNDDNTALICQESQ
ncbi:MAG: tRNA (N(6)-L-threonylcarbamoyladenosine(37)-C(2))-methylthiotransferase MtaB [Alloprevotella sp.]|nr:tRNA (N(6)-L-threonylcarbamoyladenosine(37)-C(2))-methylthiotransferase MtaB [Alloprevotella sp.]